MKRCIETYYGKGIGHRDTEVGFRKTTDCMESLQGLYRVGQVLKHFGKKNYVISTSKLLWHWRFRLKIIDGIRCVACDLTVSRKICFSNIYTKQIACVLTYVRMKQAILLDFLLHKGRIKEAEMQYTLSLCKLKDKFFTIDTVGRNDTEIMKEDRTRIKESPPAKLKEDSSKLDVGRNIHLQTFRLGK